MMSPCSLIGEVTANIIAKWWSVTNKRFSIPEDALISLNHTRPIVLRFILASPVPLALFSPLPVIIIGRRWTSIYKCRRNNVTKCKTTRARKKERKRETKGSNRTRNISASCYRILRLILWSREGYPAKSGIELRSLSHRCVGDFHME